MSPVICAIGSATHVMTAPGDTDAMGEMGTSDYTWKYLKPTNMFLGSAGPNKHTSNMPVYIDRTSGSTTHNRDGQKQDDNSNYVRCDNFAGEGGETSAYTWKYLELTKMFLGSAGPNKHISASCTYLEMFIIIIMCTNIVVCILYLLIIVTLILGS